MNILAIYRAMQFSPNSIERDKAILDAVAEQFSGQGHEVTMIDENCLSYASCPWDLILTMGRLPATLQWLSMQDVLTINTPQAIDNCRRSNLEQTMVRIGTPIPPREGPDGYWLKRGDAAAQTCDDVVYAADKQTLERQMAMMRKRGISTYVVSAHVKGDLLKFYGVGQNGFFRCFYPTDDGLSKFGDETRNGRAAHYTYDRGALEHEVYRLAAATGVDVYGGDCIVRADGSFCIIDFNDWPSFSRCRDEAADAIVRLANEKISNMAYRYGNI